MPQVAADQLLYAPLWYTMFFSVLGLMEGQAPAAVRTRIVEDVPKMVVTNWKVWIPVMIVSFQVTAPQSPHRPCAPS